MAAFGPILYPNAVLHFRWVDREIRKLIELIKTHGTLCEGKRTILFGDLFKVGALCGSLAWIWPGLDRRPSKRAMHLVLWPWPPMHWW